MDGLLGMRIRDLREERNMTQEQAAEKLGMSRQKYARIEKGVNDVTLTVLSGLAAMFEVSVSDITEVLDQENTAICRKGVGSESSIQTVYEMLDLFYANKHVYERIHYKDKEQEESV